MDNTRAFLANVIPALKAMRPLIDAGILVLVPAEKSYLQHAEKVDQLKLDLMAKVAGDPLQYSERFRPRTLQRKRTYAEPLCSSLVRTKASKSVGQSNTGTGTSPANIPLPC